LSIRLGRRADAQYGAPYFPSNPFGVESTSSGGLGAPSKCVHVVTRATPPPTSALSNPATNGLPNTVAGRPWRIPETACCTRDKGVKAVSGDPNDSGQIQVVLAE